MNLQENKWAKIPNYLTIFRIVLVPIIVALLFIQSPILYQFEFLKLTSSVSITFFVSGLLFVIACITDFLDGYLARKNNWISDFGKIWDPVADKLLTSSLFISFAVLNLIPFYFVIIMVARDVIVDAYRQSATKKGIVTPANIYGKLKTIFQMLAIIVIFFIFNWKDPNSFQSTVVEYYLIQNLFVIVATITSVASMCVYIKQINNSLNTKE